MFAKNIIGNLSFLNFGRVPAQDIKMKLPETAVVTTAPASTGKENNGNKIEIPNNARTNMNRVSERRVPERIDVNPDMEWVKLPLSSGGWMLPPNPYGDGVDHINVNIEAKTELGRMLSHFYYSPFVHPMYGNFTSIESFWQWIKSVERPESIRTMSAASAKKEGRGLLKRKVPQFYEVIADANYLRIVQNPEIYEALMLSELPFDTHYRNTGGLAKRPQDAVKMIKQFEQIRYWLKNNIQPPELDYERILYTDAD